MMYYSNQLSIAFVLYLAGYAKIGLAMMVACVKGVVLVHS